jgi:hypothetical protein
MKIYRDFLQRLYHRVPHRVEPGALLHMGIKLDPAQPQRTFINSFLGPAILYLAIFSERTTRWHVMLFLLMPDHLHAVLRLSISLSASHA